jgi:hypothetical protein
MKKKYSFAILFAAIALITAGIVYAFNTPVALTAGAVTSANVVLYSLSTLGIINIPAGALGAYVGAPGADTPQGVGVQVISGERSRAAYMTYKTNPEFSGKEITPSYLRFEALLVNGQNKIVFKHYVGDGTTSTPTERRLERNDKFGITEIGFFILRQADGKTGGDLISFADAQVFGVSAPDIAAIYDEYSA